MRIDKKTRKNMKASARSSLKKHYLMFVLMCFFASFIGAEFATADNFLTTRTDPVEVAVVEYQDDIIAAERRVENITGASAYSNRAMSILNGIDFEDEKKDEIFSRSKGTINHVIDYLTSGTIVSTKDRKSVV